MKIWKDCEMTTFNHDDTPTETIPCEVKLDENKIIVSYKENGIPVLYKGEEISEGHFKLKPEGKNGEASLHKFKENEYLEGHWHEDTWEGMWRIQLNE